jgi:hypothetical protein
MDNFFNCIPQRIDIISKLQNKNPGDKKVIIPALLHI